MVDGSWADVNENGRLGEGWVIMDLSRLEEKESWIAGRVVENRFSSRVRTSSFSGMQTEFGES